MIAPIVAYLFPICNGKIAAFSKFSAITRGILDEKSFIAYNNQDPWSKFPFIAHLPA